MQTPNVAVQTSLAHMHEHWQVTKDDNYMKCTPKIPGASGFFKTTRDSVPSMLTRICEKQQFSWLCI